MARLVATTADILRLPVRLIGDRIHLRARVSRLDRWYLWHMGASRRSIAILRCDRNHMDTERRAARSMEADSNPQPFARGRCGRGNHMAD